ncbi:MAG TPA: primosomal protein N' [Bacillota bacterium]|nr:primosomal protein N' [Bacillota bacterium]
MDTFCAVAVDVAAAGTDRPFHYRVPPSLAGRLHRGQRVRVPFGPRRVVGWFLEDVDQPDVADLKDIASVVDPEPLLTPELLDLGIWLAGRYCCRLAQALRALVPADLREARVHPREEDLLYPVAGAPDPPPTRKAQIRALALLRESPGLTRQDLATRAGCGPAAVRALIADGLAVAQPVQVRRDPFAAEAGNLPAEPVPEEPTQAQADALAAILPAVRAPRHQAFLLDGVTGSGKTEVYLRAIAATLEAGRRAICLVPEIALTPQTAARFRSRFGDRVAVLHSGLGEGERHDEWWRIRRGEVGVVVGARSAIFAPLPDLGLIVLDEEHEGTYKQDEVPRYHARAVAMRRAAAAGIPLILGSATPSLESQAAAADGRLQRLHLPARVLGRPMPTVRVVDMRTEMEAGNRSVLSRELHQALADRLQRREQALLFLNRRGFATFVLCRSCGYVARCPRCAVSLGYHASEERLRCHYCGYVRRPPTVCPRCGSHYIRYFGSGTERVESAVREAFPAARVLRMDVDTTGTKGSHARIYGQFRRGEADVLIGTQMVAKGWDIAGVTLVGVVSADTALNLPDFRSAERTFQLLCQVSGRAGRGDRLGEVLIQTYTPEHPAIMAAASQDSAGFAEAELSERRAAGWPPAQELVRLVVSGPEAEGVAALAQAVARGLRGEPGVEVLGPSEAPLALLRGQHRWHLALRGPEAEALRAAAAHAQELAGKVRGKARLSVDVDPQSML